MMVSRQETQRALLTPGEVMQLPASDEIVMLSGAPPAMAKKLRYFEDANFTGRLLSSAEVEWSGGRIGAPWTSEIAVPFAKADQASSRDDTGGQALKRAREPDYEVEIEDEVLAAGPEIVPDQEDDASPSDETNLETIRRAVAADRADPDFLPEF